jgi:prephenate dehydrogenase
LQGNASIAAQNVSLIILCASPEANLRLLTDIAPILKPGQVVIDVTSVKSTVCSLAENSDLGGADFVGGHPFFGSPSSGFAASHQIRPESQTFCLVPTKKSSELMLRRLTKWLMLMQLHVEVLSAREHDVVAAYTSHLPQLLASLLGSQLQRNLDHKGVIYSATVSGSTFQSLRRLMNSPAPMWKEIIRQNKVEVLGALGKFETALHHLYTALKDDDFAAMDQIFSDANVSVTAAAEDGR